MSSSAGLVLALTLLCFKIFSPFITMMAWVLILGATIYPGHQALVRRLGGKQGLAAILLEGGIALNVAPTAVVLASMGDSVHETIERVKDNKLEIPAPPARVADHLPIVGPKLHGFRPWCIRTCRRSSRGCSRNSANWPPEVIAQTLEVSASRNTTHSKFKRGRNLEHPFDRQRFEQVEVQAFHGTGARLGCVPRLPAGRIRSIPCRCRRASVVHGRHRRGLEHLVELACQHRTVDDDAHFGVEARGARIEVE